MSAADVPEDALRMLKHADWLTRFALTLKETRMRRGEPVTPFLLGAISRLQMAADYIRLLENDLAAVAEHEANDNVGPVTDVDAQ